jgi:hypothetical protein
MAKNINKKNKESIYKCNFHHTSDPGFSSLSGTTSDWINRDNVVACIFPSRTRIQHFRQPLIKCPILARLITHSALN